MDIIESVTKCQIDSLSPTVKALLEGVVRMANDFGPINLHASLEDRVEIQCLVRKIKERKRFGHFRILVEPDELGRRIEDNQPDPLLYACGDTLPHEYQRMILGKCADRKRRQLLPPVFLVLTHATPEELREQGVWREDFRKLFDERRLSLTGPANRSPDELEYFFRICLERAAAREEVRRYKLDRGALDLLVNKWRIQPPASLLMIVAVANKIIKDAKQERVGFATDIALAEPLLLNSKHVLGAYMPDCELADAKSSDAMVH